VPDEVRAAIDAQRLAVLRGDCDVDPLDGHAMLTRLKIAAALMILGGRAVVTADDWELAGKVMRCSQRTRERVEEVLAERRRKINRAKARDTADRNEVVADSRLQRAADTIIRRLEREQPLQRAVLRRALRSDQRAEFDAAVAQLMAQGLVVTGDDGFALAASEMDSSRPRLAREGVDTSTPLFTPNAAGQTGWTGVDRVDTTNSQELAFVHVLHPRGHHGPIE
jgi:hypothetical protein